MGIINAYTTTSGIALQTAYFKVVNANVSNPVNGNDPSAASIPGFTPGQPVVSIQLQVFATQTARQQKLPPVDRLNIAGQPTITVSSSTSILGVVYNYLMSLPQFAGASEA